LNKYEGKIVKLSDGKPIPSEEPRFILRAQDVLAPIAVRYYADLIEGATGDFKSAQQIRTFAEIMANWRPRKLPD